MGESTKCQKYASDLRRHQKFSPILWQFLRGGPEFSAKTNHSPVAGLEGGQSFGSEIRRFLLPTETHALCVISEALSAELP